jgi:hypothetical protein
VARHATKLGGRNYQDATAAQNVKWRQRLPARSTQSLEGSSEGFRTSAGNAVAINQDGAINSELLMSAGDFG